MGFKFGNQSGFFGAYGHLNEQIFDIRTVTWQLIAECAFDL